MNRTQALVLAFFAFVWVSLVLILVLAPDIYDSMLGQPGYTLPFLAGISALIAVIAMGTVRRWRWTYWLLVVAFIFGVLRVPASVLQLTGVLPAPGPPWYVIFQAVIGLAQFAIGLALLAGYRRAGVWGRF